MAVASILEGYHTATPYVAIKNAGDVLGFLKSAFGAEEIDRTIAREEERETST